MPVPAADAASGREGAGNRQVCDGRQVNGWGLGGKRSAPELLSRCCPFSSLPVSLLLPGCSRVVAGGYSGSRNGATGKAPTAGLWSCCYASEHELERIERLRRHLAAMCSRSTGCASLADAERRSPAAQTGRR